MYVGCGSGADLFYTSRFDSGRVKLVGKRKQSGQEEEGEEEKKEQKKDEHAGLRRSSRAPRCHGSTVDEASERASEQETNETKCKKTTRESFWDW